MSDFTNCALCGEPMESAEWSVSFTEDYEIKDWPMTVDKDGCKRLCPSCIVEAFRELSAWQDSA